MKLTDNFFFYPEHGMLDCNTYVIKDDVTVIIDPGFTQYLPALVRAMHEDGIEASDIGMVVNTHLHADHYWANEAFKEMTGAQIICHPLQKQHYDVNVNDVARFFGFSPVEFKEDSCLENDTFKVGNVGFELIRAPGHSPDSVCFYCREQKVLISGDVIFSQNIGRVDLPGGRAEDLKQSIEGLAKLDIDYLLPGHMGIVRGAQQVKDNFDFVRKYVFSWL